MKKESIKENEEMFISGLQWINRDNQRTIVLHSQGKEVWRTGEKTESAAKSKAGLIPLLFFLFFIFITDYTCYNTLPDRLNKGKGEKKKTTVFHCEDVLFSYLICQDGKRSFKAISWSILGSSWEPFCIIAYLSFQGVDLCNDFLCSNNVLWDVYYWLGTCWSAGKERWILGVELF